MTTSTQFDKAQLEKLATQWRKQHPNEPWGEEHAYEGFEHAYRMGYHSFLKHGDRKFHEVEDSVAKDYEHGRPGEALPWDTVRPAVSSLWDRMSGALSARDPGRGVRSFI